MQRTNYKKLLYLLEEYLKLGCHIRYSLCGNTIRNNVIKITPTFTLVRPDNTCITEEIDMEKLLINIGKLE